VIRRILPRQGDFERDLAISSLRADKAPFAGSVGKRGIPIR
jgi:hypothetical protein